MKRQLIILSIFLLLFLPLATASGTMKVIDKNGSDVTTDRLTNESREATQESGQNVTYKQNNTNNDNDESSLKAVQTAFENALNGFTHGIIDCLFEGAAESFESDVDDGALIVFDTGATEDENGITYNIQVRNINPFDHPIVIPSMVISFCFLILVTVMTVLISILITAFESKDPEKYGEWKRTLSGSYEPYNSKRVHATCMWAIVRPVKGFILFLIILYCRYLLISTMAQNTIGVPVVNTDNIVLQALTGISIFVGAFQTEAGEYGIYIFATLFFIIYILTDFLHIAKQPETAKKVEKITWAAFLLFCFCDILNMLFTSFGVTTSQWRGNSIFVTIGIIAGASINTILLTVLTIYVIFSSKKALGV